MSPPVVSTTRLRTVVAAAALGAVYRVSYVVEPDGRVAGATPDSGAACVQDALRRWVESFQYAPLAGPLPATIDWMAVTAARGG